MTSMNSIEAAIHSFLVNKGVVPFWADSALSTIREGLQSNTHFATEVLRQRVTVNKGRIRTYQLTFQARLPDSGKSVEMLLTYKFKPSTPKKAHQLWVRRAEDGA